ncbi:MAG: site-specific integrase [Actinobacteria bacterium]|nr:site-specific integrase [Actinomycetota bacterium]
MGRRDVTGTDRGGAMAYIRPVYDRKSRGQPSSAKPIGYEVRYRDADGIQRTKGGFRRKREAEAYAVEVESSRQQGTLIPHRRASTRFDEVATAWLASIQSRRKPKTVEGYQRLLRVHVLPAFGNRRVGSITYSDADRFVRSIEGLGRKPGTVRNAFFVLKMVLDYAIRDGHIRVNPCIDVDLPSAQSPEMLFLTGAQVRALASAIDERWTALQARREKRSEGPAPYGLLVETAAFTGLRAGELAALRVANLNLRAGTAHVVSSISIVAGKRVEGAPKTRAGRRTVIVNRALCDRLRAHLGDRLVDRDALVFTQPDGTPLKFGSFYSQRFKPAVRAVLPGHLHGLRFHDLRHTYASLLVEQGAHPKEMAELMGHSSVQITLDRYSHVMPRLTTALADRMDSAYRDAEPTDTAGDNGDSVVIELGGRSVGP